MIFEWIAIGWLAVMLVVMLIINSRMKKRVIDVEKEKSEAEKRALVEAEKLVKEAKDKAVEIIGEAEVNADKWRQVADQEMEKLTNQQLGEYKDKIQKLSIDIEKGVKSGAEEIKNTLEQEAFEVEKSVVKRIEMELAEADKEVEKYREEKINQINQKADAALEAVVKKIFSKSIDLVDHETLIIKALEEAKRENAI